MLEGGTMVQSHRRSRSRRSAVQVMGPLLCRFRIHQLAIWEHGANRVHRVQTSRFRFRHVTTVLK